MKNHDAGDVRGLEEVFLSQEISRASGGVGGESGTTSAEGRDDALLRRMFGHAASARRDHHWGDETGTGGAPAPGMAPATDLDAALMPERDSAAGSSGGGAASGGEGAAVSTGPPWKRKSGRYWTIAALSALVALVVAGVTAGSGQQGPSSRSAQGAPATAGPHGVIALPGNASTGPTAPGSMIGSIGSDALALATRPAGARGSGNEPGGQVTLIGAATTTGTVPRSSGGSAGGGSAGTSPGSSGTNPVPPAGAGVGSTVATVGTSVTGLANQLGSTVPATAPATSAVSGAVSGVLDSVDQAVGATTL